MLYGNYGCGKSRLASAIAGQAHSAGRPVLILDIENPKVAVVPIRSQQALPKDDPQFVWWHRETRRTKADGQSVIEQPSDPDGPVVREWLERNRGAVMVVDSIGRYLARGGIDENSTSDVNRKMGEWDAVKQTGATILYIHHVNKSGAMRGSVAIPGFCDQVYECLPRRNSGSAKITGVELRPEKTRISVVDSIELRYVEGKFVLGGEEQRRGFAAL